MKNKSPIKILVALAVIFLVLWSVSNISSLYGVVGTVLSVLAPILAGFAIAFILNIPLRFLERYWVKWFTSKHRGLRRAVCILLCLIGLAGVVALILWFILPHIFATVRDKILDVGHVSEYIGIIESLYGKITAWLAGFSINLPPLDISVDNIMSLVQKYLSSEGNDLIGQSVGIATAAFSAVFDAVFAAAIAIYVLAQKERLGRQARKMLYGIFSEKHAERLLAMARLTEKTFSKFITGQLIEAVILASLCFVGMLIFRMPFPLVISTVIGVTALIPIFGAFIGAGIGAVLIFMDAPIMAIWFIIFILVLQQIEGNLIYPKVVGTHVGLPGLWVLVAVSIGSEFGILGMLIAVPVASLLYTVLRQIVNALLKKKGLEGMFEEIEPEKKKKEKKGFFAWLKKKKKPAEAENTASPETTEKTESSEDGSEESNGGQ